MKLGKLPHRHDERTLRLAAFLSPHLVYPPSCDWSLGTAEWPMHSNDVLGCCAIAETANGIAVWTGIARQREIHITDPGILSAYEAIGGYDPADPSTDGGCVMLDIYKTWRKAGLWGHTIDAFALVDHAQIERVKAAIWLFGGLGLGFQLPASVDGADSWEMAQHPGPEDAAGSLGGHAVRCVGYDARGLTVISWGKLIRVSWAFFVTYCEEAFASLSCDWLDATGHSPSGFDRPGLLAAARAAGTLIP